MYSKLQKKYFLILSLFASALISCNQNKVEELTTELRVTISIDSVSQPNAKVKLYRSVVDMETRTAATDSGITDGNGKIVFKNLKSVLYYIHAYYADENIYYDNSYESNRLNDDLVDGAVTVANIQLENKRPALPTYMTFKSINVISFDTTLSNTLTHQSCSERLLFEIVAFDGGEQVLNTLVVRKAVQYCITGNKPTTGLSIPVNEGVKIKIKDYSALFLNAIKVDDNDSLIYYPVSAYTSTWALNISDFNLKSFWTNEAIKGQPLPNRIRLLEGDAQSPKKIKTTVDIKVDWE